MLNRQELINYRLLRGVSQYDVAEYGGISQTLVSMMENGERPITEENHKKYCDGLNAAYNAKQNKGKSSDNSAKRNAAKENVVKTIKNTSRKKREKSKVVE